MTDSHDDHPTHARRPSGSPVSDDTTTGPTDDSHNDEDDGEEDEVAEGDDPTATDDARNRPLVGVVMGSDSDLDTMRGAVEVLDEFDIPREVRVTSAHRTPEAMLNYAAEAAGRGLRVLIAGAGGAAHLPGMLASMTSLPVIGVPVPLRHLDGLDSLLSIVQMPKGVPVATVAVGNATNAGLLAIRILAASDPDLRQRMDDYRLRLRDESHQKDQRVIDATRSSGT